VTGGGQGIPGSNVVIYPGTYAANPAIASGKCYFLSNGVYRFLGGYTNNGGFVSNELKPPDEPKYNSNTQPATRQFWNTNGVNCAGGVQITITGVGGVTIGQWGVELTSVRNDTYGGVPYMRESAPSRCQQFNVTLLQLIQLQVSNVPGADSYNIYLSPTGCSGPFGLVYNMPVTTPVQNTDTSGCPFVSGGTCTLGSESLTVAAAALPFLPVPILLAPPGFPGAYPPSSETAPLAAGLPNQNPARGAGAGGDRANENSCRSAGAYVTCPGAVTPGAVEFYLPAGGCLNLTNSSDTYVFSGYQYNWLSVYEPGAASPPANTCANSLGANGNSAFVGLVYMPSASANVTSAYGFEVPGMGGLIVDRVSFTGGLPSIAYNSNYAPGPPASRLIG
jgi:hypothetical protein